jgi:hypothetical protein
MTVLPRPFWSEWAMTGSPCCESADSIYLSFAKSIIGSPQFIQQAVLDAERSELEQSLREAKQLGDHEEALYLEMALSEIAGRQTVFNRQLPTLQESYLEKKSSQKIPSSLFLTLSSSFNNNNNNNSSLPVQFQFIPQASPLSLTPPALPMEDPFADLEQQAANELSSESEKVEQSVDSLSANFKGAMCLKVGSPSPLSPASLSNNNNNINNNINKPADGSMYYFYQAADGQPLYLHPLEIKILKSEYGSYDRFPDEICVRLSAITESTLTEVCK